MPEKMANEIERFIQRREDLGYRSLSEFVIDAARRRKEELEAKEAG